MKNKIMAIAISSLLLASMNGGIAASAFSSDEDSTMLIATVDNDVVLGEDENTWSPYALDEEDEADTLLSDEDAENFEGENEDTWSPEALDEEGETDTLIGDDESTWSPETLATDENVSDSSILSGDVNSDGKIDILDVITINRAILGKADLTDAQKNAADVNQNHVPDSADALLLMKYITGLVSSFQ